MVSVIEVKNLQKTYRDGTQAVKGVSFDVQRGEIFGLLGPNGAGKTTTMKILGTLNRATGGSARVLGMDVASSAGALRHEIGFAMQEVGMDELASAEEMLLFHASLYNIPKAEAQRRTDALLKTFELEKHRKRRVSRFSGGMQRRLDLAVSLIHEPKVLFLDEPSTGLDPKSRSDLWAILQRLRREKGLTIVLSTHYMEEADVLCDRIAIINAGEVQAIGSPAQLKAKIGADTLEFQTRDQVKIGAIQALFGKAAQVTSDHGFSVRVRNGSQSLLPAMQAIHGAGILVVGTNVRRPTLDDVFLRFTGTSLEAKA